MELAGRVVLVTGASSGIGRAATRLLAARGAVVAAVARRAGLLAELVDELAAAGHQARACPADVGRWEEAAAAVTAVTGRYGRLDAVVNNAAVARIGSLSQLEPDEVAEVLRTNVLGAVHVCQSALPWLRRQEEAAIVNVSSPAGKLVIPYLGAYCASKAALDVFTGALRAELQGTGIRVLEFNPGMTRTGLFAGTIGDAHPFLEVVAAKGEPPEAVARLLVRQLERGGPPVVYARARSRWQSLAGRLLGPRWLARRMDRWARRHGFEEWLLGPEDKDSVPPQPAEPGG